MSSSEAARSSSSNNGDRGKGGDHNSRAYRHPAMIQKVIEHLRDEVGINFLALDFDQTILGIHTRGVWKGSLEELFPHVRPVYAQLIRAALAGGIEVAVVTFTSQTFFVRGVLDHVFFDFGDAGGGAMDAKTLSGLGLAVQTAGGHFVDTTRRIPIRGGDRSWRYHGTGSCDGKQPHMASAVEELEARRDEDHSRERNGERNGERGSNGGACCGPPEPITRRTTLLLDDDARNIRVALQNGTRAVWFDPKRPDKLLPELANLS